MGELILSNKKSKIISEAIRRLNGSQLYEGEGEEQL